MASSYTSNQLLEVIKNNSMLPDGGLSVGTDDTALLEHANAALRTKILPECMKFREEYFLVTTRTALTAGTARYRLPTRAAGQRLRDLYFIDSGGNRIDVEPIAREELETYNGASSGDPERFYLEGVHVVLLPTPSGGSLEMSFYFAPSDLVLTSAARQITAVSLATKTITLATSVPTDWTNADTFDVHSQNSGAEIKVWDAAATVVSGTGITFTAAIDGTVSGTTAIEIGDWCCLAGECAVPALPKEIHPMLARATALRVCEALGDANKTQIHAALLRDDMGAMVPLLNSRVEGRPMVVTGRNGMLWEGKRWR